MNTFSKEFNFFDKKDHENKIEWLNEAIDDIESDLENSWTEFVFALVQLNPFVHLVVNEDSGDQNETR